MMRRRAAAVVLVFVAALGGGCARTQPPRTREMRLGTTTLSVEIARTRKQRATGLSGRESLDADRGMLFLFAEPRRPAFWMRGVDFDIDVAFIDRDGRIVEIARMRARDETRHEPDVPVLYALEVSAGLFETAGVAVGDRVDLPAEVARMTVEPDRTVQRD